jgi:hypothetical protein
LRKPELLLANERRVQIIPKSNASGRSLYLESCIKINGSRDATFNKFYCVLKSDESIDMMILKCIVISNIKWIILRKGEMECARSLESHFIISSHINIHKVSLKAFMKSNLRSALEKSGFLIVRLLLDISNLSQQPKHKILLRQFS